MNSEFQTVNIRQPADWVEVLPAIMASDLDVFIVDQAKVGGDCGELLQRQALAQGWGICGAATLRRYKIFDKPTLGVWSAGRRIISSVGLSCELTNRGSGEMPSRVKSSGPEGGESIWGSAVYIRREALTQLKGFDLTYIQRGGAPAPNMIWDDLCLQARLKRIRVGCESTAHSIIDASGTEYPEESPAYDYWEEKWGWNPLYPNLYKIRLRWQGTAIAKPILEDLLEPWDSPTPPVDGIMLTCNSLPHLRLTLAALAKTDYPHFRLIILMNGSPEEVRSELESVQRNFPFPIQLLYCPVNVGVSPGLNWLVTQCSAPVVARLDDDIEMPPSWLEEMVGVLRRHPFCGAVIPSYQIPLPGGRMFTVGEIKTHPFFIGVEPVKTASPAGSLYMTCFMGGACVLFRRKALRMAGPNDLRFAPSQNEDVDHGLSVRLAGYDVMILGCLVFIHHTNALEGTGYNYSLTKLAQRNIFFSKWGRALKVMETSLDRAGRVVDMDPRAVKTEDNYSQPSNHSQYLK